MKNTHQKNRGFTLVELLVVIAIISLLSTIVLTSLNAARAKARDAARISDIHQLQNALALYFDKYGTYPVIGGGYSLPNQPSSCDGTLATVLAPLVAEKFIGGIPQDPINVDSGNGRFCYNYYTNTNCGSSAVASNQGYALRFNTERADMRNPKWFDQTYAAGGIYCAFPLESGI